MLNFEEFKKETEKSFSLYLPEEYREVPILIRESARTNETLNMLCWGAITGRY